MTDAVRDIAGNPVKPDPKFTACIDAQANDYCARLKKALAGATMPGNIVAASVFTTMSATAWLENVRDLLPQVALGFAPLGTQSRDR